MNIVNLLAAILITQILILLPVYVIIVRKKVSIKNFKKWKKIEITTNKSTQEMIAELRELYRSKLIINLAFRDKTAVFQDKPSFASWKNIYVITPAKSEYVSIHYRGAHISRFSDRLAAESLSSMIGILPDDS
ncbi:MAG: hypothetical protein P9L91_10790 [Candidatus Zophobacter franzmannii]|nr:hypothetical protein [Candidatus Zophobacter franzmannii]